jgi:cephalosporin hydroxylase
VGIIRTWRWGRKDREKQASEAVIAEFHKLYYDAHRRGGTWIATSWLGVAAWKCPLDLWVYQELIHEIRPDLIVETGTAFGGSALYLASICDLVGQGEVVTIDVSEFPSRPRHGRITYLLGSSTAPAVVAQVAAMAEGKRALVILDSDHRKEHVLEELKAYSPLVGRGSYIVVEDTNVNGHPILPDFGPGPMEAVSEFLRHNSEFEVDAAREKFFMTFNPRGFLRRAR